MSYGNSVTPDNFNETMKGYIVRALQECNADKELEEKILNGLRFAIDDMTMEDARKEYKKFCDGKIIF